MSVRGQIKAELLRLLGNSYHRRARPRERVFMSAYQLFNLLPPWMQQHLAGHGRSGAGGGWYDSGAKAIAKMLQEMRSQVEAVIMDTRDLKFFFEGQGDITAGCGYGCGIYRLISSPQAAVSASP